MSYQNNLRKMVLPECVFGEGARKLAAQYAMHYGGKNIMMVTDDDLMKTPWPNEIKNEIESLGLNCTIFKEVSPNPRDFEVMNGYEEYIEADCDVIVAVGGGSVMDCAKGIGIMTANGRDILFYEGVDKIDNPIPPLICVPTTSGSSADVSQFAIILDTDKKRKMAIISKWIVPDVALVDPKTLTTMSDYLAACTLMDALTHAIEAYVSTGSSVFTNCHAKTAIQTISEIIDNLNIKNEDPETRVKMMSASMHAGMAFSNASLGLVHAMAHSVGGYTDQAHGECNAMLLDHVIEFNYESAKEKYFDIALWLGAKKNDDCLLYLTTIIKKYRKKLRIREKYDKGLVDELGLLRLAEFAKKDSCMITNPKGASLMQIKELYGKIFEI